MNSFLQVDKSEWEAFLEALAKFEAKYELLLSKLDNLQSRLEAQDAIAKPEGEGREISPEKTLEAQIKMTTGESKSNFLRRLEKKLTAPKPILTQSSSQLSCRNCGVQITRATRFCSRCGVDFGKLICPCGRELSFSDRFCDHCGRRSI